MLIAPEQAFFLRENLKLRLLNARLALLSRQFDTAQSRPARGAVRARALLRPQLAAHHQCRSTWCGRSAPRRARWCVPRPDATLAAIAAVAGGR